MNDGRSRCSRCSHCNQSKTYGWFAMLLVCAATLSCKEPQPQQSLSRLEAPMTLDPNKILELRFNVKDDYVHLYCENRSKPVLGTYDTTESSINYQFLVDTSDLEGRFCWINHYGVPKDLPKSWYSWRLKNATGIIRASTKGQVTSGVLQVDFYNTLVFTIPKELEIHIDSVVTAAEGRTKVSIEKGYLFCPQDSPNVQETITSFQQAVVFDETTSVATTKYVTPFVSTTNRRQRCRQVLFDSDGFEFWSTSWFYLMAHADQGYYNAADYLKPVGRNTHIAVEP